MKRLTKREEKAFTKYCFQTKLIGEGSGRKVYSFNNYVVKIAKNKIGRIQNKTEVERFKKCGSEKLAIIYAYNKNIIIMEKVKVLYEDEEIFEFNELARWFEKEFDIISEDNMSQGITKDNRQVMFDYGETENLYTKYFAKDYSIREKIFRENEDMELFEVETKEDFIKGN